MRNSRVFVSNYDHLDVKTNYHFMSENNRINSEQWVHGLYRNHAFTNVLSETRPIALQWEYRTSLESKGEKSTYA